MHDCSRSTSDLAARVFAYRRPALNDSERTDSECSERTILDVQLLSRWEPRRPSALGLARTRPLGTRPPSAPSFVSFATNFSTYSTRKNYSIFKRNNRIQIRFFTYQIQSIVFMQTAMADLSHNKNLGGRIA